MQTHQCSGIITAVNKHSVTVSFKRADACGGCAAKSICHAGSCAESTTEVDVEDVSSYRLGQRVTLTINDKSGIFAVIVAYVLPLVLMLGGLFIPLAVGVEEKKAACAALLIPLLYYLLLYGFRQKLKNKIEIKLQ